MIQLTVAMLLALLALIQPRFAFAWGSIGHRVVGQVADEHLSDSAASATSRIMGSSSLGDVANWMDQVRGTSEGKSMKPWHYDSVEVCSPSPATCLNDNCASRRIAWAIETLRTEQGTTETDRQTQLKALRVLVHLVGDVHQPLHAAENDDGGGNAVTLKNRRCVDYKTGKTVRCKLHSYWDNSLVKKAQGQRTEREFVESLAMMNVSSDGDSSSWVRESNELAKTKVHTYDGFACGIGNNTVVITTDYDNTAVPLVKEQLAKAGARLAAVLNAIYE
jgi:hypothetical protein